MSLDILIKILIAGILTLLLVALIAAGIVYLVTAPERRRQMRDRRARFEEMRSGIIQQEDRVRRFIETGRR